MDLDFPNIKFLNMVNNEKYINLNIKEIKFKGTSEYKSIISIIISDNKQYICLITHEGWTQSFTIKLYNLETSQLIKQFEQKIKEIRSSFSEDSTILIIQAYKYHILYNIQQDQEIMRTHKKFQEIRFSYDSQSYLCGSENCIRFYRYPFNVQQIKLQYQTSNFNWQFSDTFLLSFNKDIMLNKLRLQYHQIRNQELYKFSEISNSKIPLYQQHAFVKFNLMIAIYSHNIIKIHNQQGKLIQNIKTQSSSMIKAIHLKKNINNKPILVATNLPYGCLYTTVSRIEFISFLAEVKTLIFEMGFKNLKIFDYKKQFYIESEDHYNKIVDISFLI